MLKCAFTEMQEMQDTSHKKEVHTSTGCVRLALSSADMQTLLCRRRGYTLGNILRDKRSIRHFPSH